MTRMLSKLFASMLLLIASNFAHADKVTYIYTDPQGTPIAEADEQGNITKTFDYRPYGEQAQGQPPDGPGYTGHVNDPDTDLVYMQARYYDPELGRFLSVDPVGPKPEDIFGFNRYAYAQNNPILNIDPNGREAACVSMAGHCGSVANNLPVKDLTELARELMEPLGAEQPEFRLAGEVVVAAEDAAIATVSEAGIHQTGGGVGAQSADELYDAIRANSTDVGQIAQNTGFKPENIQTVKNHVFYNEHLLDRYVDLGVPAQLGRFDSDVGMANSWIRLTEGAHTAEDIQMLRHETAEAWYMRQNGPGYSAAHDAAQARYPSPFL